MAVLRVCQNSTQKNLDDERLAAKSKFGLR